MKKSPHFGVRKPTKYVENTRKHAVFSSGSLLIGSAIKNSSEHSIHWSSFISYSDNYSACSRASVFVVASQTSAGP